MWRGFVNSVYYPLCGIDSSAKALLGSLPFAPPEHRSKLHREGFNICETVGARGSSVRIKNCKSDAGRLTALLKSEPPNLVCGSNTTG
jgi:hypothetical protein